ncbi:MAG TPA: penicillin-insensitive murein endopeptidase [Candidatus Limnocylindrales bacterium]|nr:penicillin-insensitive murein endopeptidase [Candidatus Limnocylindrales bacterium]
MRAFGRLGRPSTEDHVLTPRGTARPVRLVGATLALLAAAFVTSAAPVAGLTGVAWPTQSLGDRGTDVAAVQGLLRVGLMPSPTPRRRALLRAIVLPPLDGVFGATTADAVRRFQVGHGLAGTGIVDVATWSALAVPLAVGASGPAVGALQRELVEKRSAAVVVDWIFGSTTRSAVLALQKHAGLAQTGAVDPATWRALAWHYELPRFSSKGLCDYSVGNGLANWGTAQATAGIEAAGAWSVSHGYGRIAVGDVSFEHGGPIPGHDTHQRGLDTDIRPLRKANDQCTARTRWTYTAYDRAATRALVKAIRALAPGHVKLIYFNDPVLISEGLTTWFSGHDDHLHIRFCEPLAPIAAYRC